MLHEPSIDTRCLLHGPPFFLSDEANREYHHSVQTLYSLRPIHKVREFISRRGPLAVCCPFSLTPSAPNDTLSFNSLLSL